MGGPHRSHLHLNDQCVNYRRECIYEVTKKQDDDTLCDKTWNMTMYIPCQNIWQTLCNGEYTATSTNLKQDHPSYLQQPA